MPEMSYYLRNIQLSPIRKMFQQISKDPSITNLTLGEPDFDTPKNIVNAAKKALDKHETHYAHSFGIPELRQAIAKKYKKDYGAKFDVEKDICVTNGATSGIFTTLLSIIKPGDEVIIIDPFYVMYPSFVKMFKGKPKFVRGKIENNFKPSAEEIKKAVTRKTKAVIVISPNNPTGGIYDKQWFKSINDISKDKKIFVLHDEVYEKIRQKKHISVSQWANNEHMISFGSLSKTYAMTGWRMGWVASQHPLMKTIQIAQSYTNLTLNTFSQYGAVEAIKGTQKYAHKFNNEFTKRINYTYKRLKDMGFQINKPEGAYYLFPSAKPMAKSCIDLSQAILKHAKVGVIPGSAFGKSGYGHFRISCATSMKNLREGMDRIENNLTKIVRTCSIKKPTRVDYLAIA